MPIDGKTQLLGIIGWPVSHTKSPLMHHAAAKSLNMNLAYVPMPVHPADLEPAVHGLPALGFRGVNVTVPHKEKIIPLLDQVDPAARAIGAVNTIVIGEPMGDNVEKLPANDRLLTGYNTDWSGFLADLNDAGVVIESRDCLILGGGGAARAVAYGLASEGGQVTIFTRRAAQGQQLVEDLSKIGLSGRLQATSWPALAERSRDSQRPLIVNTTPLGMSPEEETSPWPEGLAFQAGAIVYDLVYNPLETLLMRQAKSAGCRALNGLGMLIWQGALAFQLWTGLLPDGRVMLNAIRQ